MSAVLPQKQSTLKLRVGIEAAEEDRQILQQTQEASRHDARKIASLEREVAYLRSVSHYSDQGTQTVWNDVAPLDKGSQLNARAQTENTTRSIDPEEYDQLRRDLAALNEEYGRIRFSRDVLEKKSRFYKKNLKSWQKYCKLWVDKKGPGNPERQSGSEPEHRGVNGHSHARASSAPTQLLSNGEQNLLNTYQREISSNPPLIALPTSSDTQLLSSGNALNPQVHTARTDSTQDLCSTVSPQSAEIPADSEDLIPTSVAYEDADESEKGSDSGRIIDSRTVFVKNEELDEDSDIPVITSVNPLKRKSEVNDSSRSNRPKILKEEDIPGTASKPVHVKSDPQTSSPPIKISFQRFDDAHDSIDLDDVGSKTKTPRKRQRYRLQQMRLPAAIMPSMPEAIDERNEENASSQPSILDEASCKKQGEEYGAQLWRQQQARREERQDNQTFQHHPRCEGRVHERLSRQMCMRASEQLDGELLPAADLQVTDFNQRIREAQYKKAGYTAAPKTPKLANAGWPTFPQNAGTDTRDFELPTPIATDGQLSRTSHQCPPEQPLQKSSITQSVLQPTDPNNQILPRTSELLTHEKRQCPPSRRDRGAAQIHTVLEDGEETRPSGKAKSGTAKADGQQVSAEGATKPSKVSLGAHYRLGTLLAEPSPGRPALPTEKLSVSRGVENRNSPRLPSDLSDTRNIPPVGKSPVDLPRNPRSTKVSTLTAKSKKPITYARKPPPPILATFDPTSSDDPPPILPEDEPLRSRPVHRLRREDFKINPAANKGFSHAFCEVVRKRQERRCLPNCNRPDCCGDDIRKAIALGGALPRQDRGLFKSSSPDGESGSKGYDYNVLKEYMGDHYSNWSRLSDEEKDAEWIRAQGWDFGQRFGKHKAPDRQRTPPGFWNVDVDSTQEVQKQREEGEKMAREEVTERWREAMRRGGRWKFADE